MKKKELLTRLRAKNNKRPYGAFIMVLFFALFLNAQNMYSQDKTITGTVNDNTGEPLPGASVLVKGTTIGTETDFDGNYSISVSSDVTTLVVSFIGYASQEVAIAGQSSINIQLEADASELEEVVVIGYGTAKKKDLTGAVSRVSAKSFEDQPLVRVEDALQGRASGITVAGSGAPGKAIKVRIRGVNSITGNNDPLVVVDGVLGGSLRSINPNNIASMEILKDASALAIYGSRGSNGVILITTKKGSGKATVSVDQFFTVSNQNKRLTTLTSGQFARLENEEFIANPVNDPANKPYTDAQVADFDANPIDTQDEMFQTGFTNNTQVSLSGGTDDGLRYFVSGNYMDQKGTQITSTYKRYSFRSNLTKKFNDKFTLTTNITASREIIGNSQDAFNSGDGSAILRSMTWDPTAATRDADGNYILRSPREVANNNYNPIRRFEMSTHEVTPDRLNLTMNGTWKFAKNLSYTFIGAVNTLHQDIESYRVEGDFEATGFNNISYTNNKNTGHQVSNIVNWTNSYDKHNLDITGVYEFSGSRALNHSYNVSDVKTDNLYKADNTSAESFANSGNQSAISSLLGRAQYNYDNILYLTGSVRVDESSRFAKETRRGTFPSGAVAVNFANMSFMEDSSLSTLKLRAGWGQVGNQNINASARFSQNNNAGLYTWDGVTGNTGSVQSQEGNPNLTWETTTQTNIGIDFGFLNGRINGSIDFYNKDTEDLLLQTIVPGTTIRTFINAGDVNNKGVDFSINADIIQKDDFNWNAGFNVSRIENKVTKLTDDLDFIVGNANGIGGGGIKLNVIKVGEPLGTFWGYVSEGTWKSTDNIPVDGNGAPLFQPGDAKFKLDENNQSEFNTIGSGLPDVTLGFNNNFTYKNWDLNVFINGAFGFDIYNQVRGTFTGNGGNRSNLSPDVYDRWTPENETDLPRAGTGNVLNSSRWVESGDYIRLSNLKLGYTFDDGLIKGVQSLQLYASGQNVFLISDYSGFDPEVSSQVRGGANTDAGAGIDVGAYPNPVSFTIGLKLAF